MKENDAQTTALTLLPLTSLLWLGYLLALLILEQLIYHPPVVPYWFYLLNGFNALLVLTFALWSQGNKLLGKGFLPFAIILLSIVPVFTIQLIPMGVRPTPASGPEALLLRTIPLSVMALILTAWQYGWRAVILFCSGIALFTISLHLYFMRPGGPSIGPPANAVILQTISFLVVGYFICTLVKQINAQQASLIAANRQLANYTLMQEELTISRERNRIARELHDTLAHTLTALSVQLETVKAYWEVDSIAAQRMLDDSLTTTRSGIQETRRALKSLRASPLDDLGLLLALRQLATEIADRANLRLNLMLPETLPALPPSVEQCIYRIAQEAMTNASHHANAKTLTLQLHGEETLILQVSDDGLGFLPQQAQAAGHFGVSGMYERAQLAGGELMINSQPGEGTMVRLTMRVG